MKADKLREEMFLELDGAVYIVEKKNGKVKSREVIDGKIVLQCLLHLISEACELAISNDQLFGSLKKSTKVKKR